MKLVVNTTPLLGPQTGIGNYTFHVCQELLAVSELDTTFYYGFFSPRLFRSQPQASVLSKIKDMTRRFTVLRALYRLSKQYVARLHPRRFDVYFEPNFIPLDLKATRVVTTVHDFSFHLHPDWHPEERVRYFRDHFWANVDRADTIITVSEFIRDQAVHEFGLPKERIEVIANGLDHDCFHVFSPEECAQARIRLGLPAQFILFVGSIEPRKNLARLVEAFARLAPSVRAECPLVLAGFSGWRNTAIMDALARLGDHVRYLGFVTNEDLAALYNLATVFVYPSLYEGFGLPPLEAMACGCPTLVSRTASLPEVCADAAVYADPLDSDDLAHQLRTMLEDQELRQRLCLLGPTRAQRFTWTACAQAHARVLMG
ncbi:glycosyltransferase family 1 protein [Desulfovibrionales bacterium]